MGKVSTGIDLLQDQSQYNLFKGNIGVLCHSASVDKNLNHTLEVMLKIFGERVKKVYGPQHGFVTDVQDNMVESDHFTHPYFKLPIYSLYSETRVPTDEMLAGIDHLFVDMQDVGTRIYTYIYTMTHLLEKCANLDIEVIILDRPNPIGGTHTEGNILNTKFASFVGRHELPVRHGLTMGEVALMHQEYFFDKKCNLKIIKMDGWKRDMYFEDTGLPWVLPSPNLPTVEGCFPFVGTVLFEGTNISEGRGTTRSLEIIGHPNIEPWTFKHKLDEVFSKTELTGFYLRPLNYQPTFQKHAGVSCGGYQIHVLDREKFQPWKTCQLLLQALVQELGDNFHYKKDPYEYGEGMNPMDMINGDDRYRAFYEQNHDYNELLKLESEHQEMFNSRRENILLY
jgi:uncharacterized protein YbbC (DUF1343 family)